MTEITIDDLAQEIRRVDGSHSLGAGALAEALMPFINAASPSPVVVKPLEWDECNTALTPLGTRYSIYPHYRSATDTDGWAVNMIDGLFPTLEAAKAAAQADYEQRIRSALSTPDDGWRKVPKEATQELLADASSKQAGDKQVLCYQNGEYYNAWLVFDPYEGGWIWMNEADSEPNPSHYRPLPAPPANGRGE